MKSSRRSSSGHHHSALGKKVAGAAVRPKRRGRRPASFLDKAAAAYDKGDTSAKLLFVDVDGVLLAFEPLINRLLLARGKEPVPSELLETRSHDYLSEAFPARFSTKDERQIVEDVFSCGYLRDQPGYDLLDKAAMRTLLENPRLYILTRIPPAYAVDRLACLKDVYGVDLAPRFLSVWDGETKGELLKKTCNELGVATEKAYLVDDRRDNLEGALEVGASSLLVQQSYNLSDVAPMTKKFGNRFTSVVHSDLPATLARLLR